MLISYYNWTDLRATRYAHLEFRNCWLANKNETVDKEHVRKTSCHSFPVWFPFENIVTNYLFDYESAYK